MADIDFELSQKFLYVICGLVTYFTFIEALTQDEKQREAHFQRHFESADANGSGALDPMEVVAATRAICKEMSLGCCISCHRTVRCLGLIFKCNLSHFCC